MKGISQTKPVLLLAPHLVYPTRNGADILADRTARELSKTVPFVDIIGANLEVRYENGAITSHTSTHSRMASRRIAAIKTLVFRSSYFKEKFITRGFRRAVRRRLDASKAKSTPYFTLICSYIVSASVLQEIDPAARMTRVVLTHNDEFKWFRNLEDSSRNPIARWVARSSSRWLGRWFTNPPKDVYYAHVSEKDSSGYKGFIPETHSLVMPIGADIPDSPVDALPPASRPSSVLFVGSLGVKMNLDALIHFAETYFPSLQSELSTTVHVAGSRPSPEVTALCETCGWTLHADVSDDKLRLLFEEADAAILPFAYSTGSKLKLIGALAHGVPFLATTEVEPPSELMVAPSLVSNDPREWVGALRHISTGGISIEQRNHLQAAAKKHSWEVAVGRLLDALPDYA